MYSARKKSAGSVASDRKPGKGSMFRAFGLCRVKLDHRANESLGPEGDTRPLLLLLLLLLFS